MARDKRRNTEKRKEKSRDAARYRRGKETEVFTELADCLPMQESVSHQLDKASVMRLSISVLKISSILKGDTQTKRGSLCLAGDRSAFKDVVKATEQCLKEAKMEQLYQRALEGFAFILSHDGDFVYLSESVAKYLGIQQIDLMGHSIYDFTHPCDHEEIRDVLTMKDGSSQKDGADTSESKTTFLRMKCTLTSKGRNVNLKSASYKVMKCSGRLVTGHTDGKHPQLATGSCLTVFPYLMGIAEPIPHPANIEVPLDCNTFLSKHSMDMKFIFCDDRIQELAGYNKDTMIGQSLFDFHHAMDSSVIDKAFKDLFSKGQTVTNAYRLLTCNGGYIWVITQATVINNSRTQKPQSVVCVHFVLSGIEERSSILSHVQKPASMPASILPPKMELSTESIFGPKVKNTAKAYYVPAEMKDTVTYLGNQPENLSYLAPCVDEENIILPFNQYSTDYLLSPASSLDNYGSLKQEPCTPIADMNSLKDTPVDSLMSSMASSRTSSPHSYTGGIETPADVDSMDKFFESVSSDAASVLDNIDFDMRAPYIPMDGNQDLELLPPTSSNLFNLSTDVNPALYGCTESMFDSKQFLFEDTETPVKLSARDMLGGSTAVASIEQPPDTMYLQMKRPLDKNSLEKGPPSKKAQRLNEKAPIQLSAGCARGGKKESVLFNLLLNGEDRNYGYKVCPLPTGVKMNKPTMVVQPSQIFPILTSQDCEVEAPTQFSQQLLQGPEILQALDVVAIKAANRQALGGRIV